MRLPPYHCDFNPIEKTWAHRKYWVADRNKQQKLAGVEELWKQSRNALSLDTIKATFERVKRIEEQFWKIDKLDEENSNVERELDQGLDEGEVVPFDIDQLDPNDPGEVLADFQPE